MTLIRMRNQVDVILANWAVQEASDVGEQNDFRARTFFNLRQQRKIAVDVFGQVENTRALTLEKLRLVDAVNRGCSRDRDAQVRKPLVRERNQIGIRKHHALDAQIVEPSEAFDEPSLALGGKFAISEARDIEAVEKGDTLRARQLNIRGELVGFRLRQPLLRAQAYIAAHRAV